MILKQHGYRVLEAANGADALALIRKKPEVINLLLTDVIMPGLNGRALAERLSALQPGLKVLYMSGYTEDSIVNHGVVGNGTQLLSKPFSEESLTKKSAKFWMRSELRCPPPEHL